MSISRAPAGVPAGGQFVAGSRPEAPRLRLLPSERADPDLRAADLGLDIEDYLAFERLDTLLARASFSGPHTLSALDTMTYRRIAEDIDAHARTRQDYSAMPTCGGCAQPWGTGWQCRGCTDGYDEPLPLAMRVDSMLRVANTRADRRPYWAR